MVKGCGNDLQVSKKVFTYEEVFREEFTLVTRVALGTDTFFSVPSAPIVARPEQTGLPVNPVRNLFRFPEEFRGGSGQRMRSADGKRPNPPVHESEVW